MGLERKASKTMAVPLSKELPDLPAGATPEMQRWLSDTKAAIQSNLQAIEAAFDDLTARVAALEK